MEASDQIEGDGAKIQPVAFIYALPITAVVPQEWKYLAARSADNPLCVMPLVEGLTVETGFSVNATCISGMKTNGLASKSYVARLTTTHFYPNVFIFHGGENIPPSTEAPNLTKLCNKTRKACGFSDFEPEKSLPGFKETTAAEICEKLGVEKPEVILYLVTTAAYKEAVYLANTFLHYGMMETVTMNGAKASKIPLYPIQMFMLDHIKISQTPFTPNTRLLIDNVEYPQPFFNSGLHRLLFDYIISNVAVAIRTRNVESVAMGLGYLAYEDKFEGCVISGKNYANFKATKQPGVTPKSLAELRMADSMTAELALNISSLFDSAVYDNGHQVCPYDEWPMFENRTEPEERLEALSNFYTRMASEVATMVFSINSVLYMLEIGDSLAKTKDAQNQAKDPNPYDRFFLFNGAYLGPGTRLDAEGNVSIPGEDIPIEFTRGRQPDFSLSHLAYACGFCPQLLARMFFFLERCDRIVTSSRQEQNMLKYVGLKAEEKICELCDASTAHVCAATTFFKLRYRMPSFITPHKYPFVVCGAMASPYSECDPLGNYASFSALRRQHDKDVAKNVMQDTYHVANDNLLMALEKARFINKDLGTDSDDLSTMITNRETFMAVITEVNRLIKAEAERFIITLSEDRDFKYKEALKDATQTFSLSCNPYHMGFCPLMSCIHYRTLLIVIQDLGLGHCPTILATTSLENKSARNVVQPFLRKRFLGMINKGFLSTRDMTATVKTPVVTSFDVHKPIDVPSEFGYDFEISRSTIICPKEMRLKNRIMFRGGASLAGEQTKGRFQAIAAAYNRSDKLNRGALNGPHGHLLKKYHDRLFPTNPKLIAANKKQLPAMTFWPLLEQERLSSLYLGDIEAVVPFLRFIKRETQQYDRANMIDMVPNNLYTYAQFKFTNLILDTCGFKSNYICTITPLVATVKTSNPMTAVHLLEPTIKTTEEAAQRLSKLPRHTKKSCLNFVSQTTKWLMDRFPVIACGLSISKYTGQQTGDTLFQSGNLSYLMGDGIDPATTGPRDPKRRFIVACPRVGHIAKSSAFGSEWSGERSLVETIKTLLLEGRSDVVASVFQLLVKNRSDVIRTMTTEEFTALTGDEYIGEQLTQLQQDVIAAGVGWTAHEIADYLETLTDQTDAKETFFSFANCLGEGDFLDAGQDTLGRKRKAIEEMLDHEQPKRPALDVDDMF
ncbi:single-stranded DNA-binding protein [Testudinid alphaherpesvirus 3]|uniref:Major DNA binding protein n=1 Tax=Testudinid alphaherpesvirus 3 TaxID=2560801 RepID=A0A0K1R1X8_9ALPH|nr:single-stranded DNA-binding protein [Testudinid alphaherpesvirus 3]AIU39266.1 single-stranded DNA-binding protein [Testudinid alphaherpesvirus 3]AIU39376.1 single-stranded DNA-binding protein [Testudinid alphaherpesvirus 3]AKI81652.1 single-stranded DNA-binding protein [Testudinid alphaherpesvirus 3]AKI81755.1 single-stranded DNA-binding protein [Testudinid alphaherpesvirus 3]AKV40701.1 major DNA binding protein [Testudinid alphaherpesvirus 3]